jgi:hypothetical protein
MPGTASDDSANRASRQLDARTAYQVAASLYMQENTVTWSRFNIMLTANSIILAATGVAAGGSHQLPLLAFLLPIAGCILCYTWWEMMKRGFVYHDIWRDAAYALEQQFFAEAPVSKLVPIQTLYYGEQYRSDGKTKISIGDEVRDYPRSKETSPPKGKVRARTYAERVIILFVCLYVAAIVQIFATFLTT